MRGNISLLWKASACCPARNSPISRTKSPLTTAARGERSLLHLDPARADDLGPPARVLFQEAREFLGSEIRRLGALRGELFPDIGSRERPDDVLAQGVDGFLRRPLGEREPEPVGD